MLLPLHWGAPGAGEVAWASSRDGQTLAEQGTAPLALLPHDDDVVLVLPVLQASWHAVPLPRIAAARLRQALDGVLEERLLADPDTLHLAVQPDAQPGETVWVCATDKALLTAWLSALEAAGRPVSRIVPDCPPQDRWRLTGLLDGGQAWRVAAGPRGVWALPLPTEPAAPAPGQPAAAGAGEDADADAAVCVSEPGCAALMDAAGPQRPQLETTGTRLLRASQTGWNLAQFDLRLSARIRRGQRLRQLGQQVLHAPLWRPARWGAVALLSTSVLGVWALGWQTQRASAAKEAEVQRVVRQTFPNLGLVLNAPLQMQREVQRLQRQAGVLRDDDLEAFLMDFSALAHVGIDFYALHFSNGTVQLTLNSTPDAAVAALQTGLRERGWRSTYQAPQLQVQRATDTAVAVPNRP